MKMAHFPYKNGDYIGEHVVGIGSFGVVFQAICRETREMVANKKVLIDKRYKNRELQIMQVLDHPNIVALKSSFFSTDKEELYLNLVLEHKGRFKSVYLQKQLILFAYFSNIG
ncbi:hypothetical protein SAY86_021385 [Trapa natans]|uniref:Protein kinase domain-containing protein n=1 Tax=Trapa natans TaxID=22666 RepID=A0AAN7RLK7_TRANT|nr:hypothetical protein SAY86_021385 [Trapa natans]